MAFFKETRANYIGQDKFFRPTYDLLAQLTKRAEDDYAIDDPYAAGLKTQEGALNRGAKSLNLEAYNPDIGSTLVDRLNKAYQSADSTLDLGEYARKNRLLSTLMQIADTKGDTIGTHMALYYARQKQLNENKARKAAARRAAYKSVPIIGGLASSGNDF